jgi:hypothetical protein
LHASIDLRFEPCLAETSGLAYEKRGVRPQRTRGLWFIGAGLVIFSTGGFCCNDVRSNDPFSDFDGVVMLISIGAVLCGCVLVKYGNQLYARTAREAIEGDARPPIVYLRSFREDDNRTVVLGLLEALFVLGEANVAFSTREERLAEMFSEHGPFVAIGKPGEELPTLGAARMYVKHEEWQLVALDLTRSAALVVILLGRTEGLRWEVGRALSLVGTTRVLFEVPSNWLGRKKIYDQLRGYGCCAAEPITPRVSATAAIRVLRQSGGCTPPRSAEGSKRRQEPQEDPSPRVRGAVVLAAAGLDQACADDFDESPTMGDGKRRGVFLGSSRCCSSLRMRR